MATGDQGDEFAELTRMITEIYNKVKPCEGGKVADYIPQLAQVDPNKFGISICTVKGQTFSIGDTDDRFCLQSSVKPLSYCVARELCGSRDAVHAHVGYEPSGQAFNAHVLNKNGLPHNPMINAGAIMVCSLIEPDKEPALRFEKIKEYLIRLSGKTGLIGFDNGVFLSEDYHADRNRSLAYFMRETNSFPKGTNIEDTLRLYFQTCSMTTDCSTLAQIAATLANDGVCPITQDHVLGSWTVRDCLSLMYMCGMYDYSGQFAFEVGLPAKSGVSGCMFLAIPNKLGMAVWSPRLDECGNTVQGLEVCRLLAQELEQHHAFSSRPHY